jgi:hypothetical protein
MHRAQQSLHIFSHEGSDNQCKNKLLHFVLLINFNRYDPIRLQPLFNRTCLMRMPFNLTCLMRMPFKASLRKSNSVYKPCNNHLQDSVPANKYWPIPTIRHALIESDEMCLA